MRAEYVVLEEEGVVRIPTPLSVEEGATLPCAALTAWHALVEHGKVIAGQTVLLQGTGGVTKKAERSRDAMDPCKAPYRWACGLTHRFTRIGAGP